MPVNIPEKHLTRCFSGRAIPVSHATCHKSFTIVLRFDPSERRAVEQDIRFFFRTEQEVNAGACTLAHRHQYHLSQKLLQHLVLGMIDFGRCNVNIASQNHRICVDPIVSRCNSYMGFE